MKIYEEILRKNNTWAGVFINTRHAQLKEGKGRAGCSESTAVASGCYRPVVVVREERECGSEREGEERERQRERDIRHNREILGMRERGRERERLGGVCADLG